MTKRLFVSLICTIPFFTAAAQTQQVFSKKIKVILLGTFHYGATTDAHKTAFNDLFSPARQKQLDELSAAFAKQQVNKVFVEAQPGRQPFYDSLYPVYLKHGTIDSVRFRNEIVQVGFRTAAAAKLPGVKCVDYQQELPYDALAKFEKEHKDLKNPPFFEIPWPFTDKSKQKPLSQLSLADYYKQLNSQYARQQSLFDYLHYAPSYGVGNDYTGVSLTTSFYDRNLKIYTNILRELRPDDTCILIIFGSSHTAFLRQFFEGHPLFEVVELDSFL